MSPGVDNVVSGLGRLYRPWQPERRGSRRDPLTNACETNRRCRTAQEAGDDQVERDDVIQQTRHDQDEYAREEGDERRNAETEMQVHG